MPQYKVLKPITVDGKLMATGTFERKAQDPLVKLGLRFKQIEVVAGTENKPLSDIPPTRPIIPAKPKVPTLAEAAAAAGIKGPQERSKGAAKAVAPTGPVSDANAGLMSEPDVENKRHPLKVLRSLSADELIVIGLNVNGAKLNPLEDPLHPGQQRQQRPDGGANETKPPATTDVELAKGQAEITRLTKLTRNELLGKIHSLAGSGKELTVELDATKDVLATAIAEAEGFKVKADEAK